MVRRHELKLILNLDALVVILAIIYPLLVGLLGQVFSGVLYADFLLPFMVILIAYNINFLPPLVLKSVFALLLYSFLASLISVAFFDNEIIYASMLLSRTISFFIILLFYFVVSRKGFEKISSISFSFVLFGSFLITLKNISSGSRAYYGYSQLAASYAPAISGFVFGVLALYFFIRYWEEKRFLSLASFFLALFLVFSTYSISGNMALLGAFSIFLFLILFSKKDFIFKKIKLISFLVLGLFFVFVFSDYLLAKFSRVTRLFSKLDNRIYKSNNLIDTLCNDFSCAFFGIGPGGHSTYNKIGLGEGSILAFDQLYGRILLEWGWLGSFFWLLVLFVFLDLYRVGYKVFYNPKVISFLAFGLIFGMGSEWIFVAFSGSFYAAILGLILGSKNKFGVFYSAPIKKSIF